MQSPVKKKSKTDATFAQLIDNADTPEKLLKLSEDVRVLAPEITKKIKGILQ